MLRNKRDWNGSRPLLDIASYARRGSGERFSPQELDAIALTVRRTPEVVVKISGAATTVRGAFAHLKYIDRAGNLSIETDRGESLQERGVGLASVEIEAEGRADGRQPRALDLVGQVKVGL